MPAAPATAPLLHRSLGIGLVMMAAVMSFLRYRGLAPTLPPDGIKSIAYALSALSVVLVAVALLVIKPHVPERLVHQSIEEFWSTPKVGAKAFLVWFLLDGAGMMAAVGYLLTGQPVTVVAMGLAIVAFWLCGPNVFAKA
jgi:hypothetical protein